MESTASTIAEPITCRNLEISTTIDRLLADRREHTRDALVAFHRTRDTAFHVLQESIGALDHSDDQILELVKDLTAAALDHVSALSLAVHGEADVRIKAAVEETLKQRQEAATLSERLGEVETELIGLRVHRDAETDRANAARSEADRFKQEAEELSERLTAMLTEMKALRAELDLERRQAVTIISDLHQARRASAQAEASRAEALAARQSEMSQRLTVENELQDALARLEATRGEADGIRQKLRAAAALATELIAASDNLDSGSQPTMRADHSADGAHREGDPDEQSGEDTREESTNSMGSSGAFELLLRRIRR